MSTRRKSVKTGVVMGVVSSIAIVIVGSIGLYLLDWVKPVFRSLLGLPVPLLALQGIYFLISFLVMSIVPVLLGVAVGVFYPAKYTPEQFRERMTDRSFARVEELYRSMGPWSFDDFAAYLHSILLVGDEVAVDFILRVAEERNL